MNLSTDLSIYKTNTKKHPVHKVPEVKIEIFEDIPRLHVSVLNSISTCFKIKIKFRFNCWQKI